MFRLDFVEEKAVKIIWEISTKTNESASHLTLSLNVKGGFHSPLVNLPTPNKEESCMQWKEPHALKQSQTLEGTLVAF